MRNCVGYGNLNTNFIKESKTAKFISYKVTGRFTTEEVLSDTVETPCYCSFSTHIQTHTYRRIHARTHKTKIDTKGVNTS